MPFTSEQFFQVFTRYNQALAPAPLLLTATAVIAFVLASRARPGAQRAAAAILAFLWAWAGIAYHLAFFTAVNPAAYGFGVLFLLQALLFAWFGTIRGRLVFAARSRLEAAVAGLFVAYGLFLYPLLTRLDGHRPPAAPTFGVPCPTTLFTVGMLLLAAPPLPRSLLVVPLLWSAIGSFAAFQLDVRADLGLLAAAAALLYLLRRG